MNRAELVRAAVTAAAEWPAASWQDKGLRNELISFTFQRPEPCEIAFVARWQHRELSVPLQRRPLDAAVWQSIAEFCENEERTFREIIDFWALLHMQALPLITDAWEARKRAA